LSISDLLKFGVRKTEEQPGAAGDTAAPKGPETVVTSKALPKFINALSHHESPVLVDFGPVIGTNVAFFGEHLGCKLHIEDLATEIDKHTRTNTRDALPQSLAARFTQPDGSVDGVLCWDIFDFLDKPSGLVLASKLAKMVRRGGALYGTFGTTPVELKNFTRTVVAAEDSLKPRPYPATPTPRTVLLTRDIIKMFDGLIVAESMLLKSSTRETLFRRP